MKVIIEHENQDWKEAEQTQKRIQVATNFEIDVELKVVWPE